MEKTQAIVLKHLKYGDTGLILHFYTQKMGMLPFIFKGFYTRKKKNNALLFPLTEVELTFSLKNKTDLKTARSIGVNYVLSEGHTHPVKSLVLQLLGEILYTVLRQDDANEPLYNYIKEQLYIFDQKKNNFADFHIWFLLRLTYFLGFQPNQESAEAPYFDLQEGCFTNAKNTPYAQNENDSRLLKKLMKMEFSSSSDNQFNQEQRQHLLALLIDYYRLHVPGFKEPKSLEIIKTLF